jgi:hypothetical protein
MNAPRRVHVLSALLLAAVVVVGCGQLPTAPALDQQAQATGAARGAEPAGLISTVTTVVDGLVRLVVRTLNIVGSVGGSLTNGRWRVDVPANAVSGNATVSLGVEGSTSSWCELEITPVTKNSFSVPVMLRADCRGVSDTALKNYVIFWYNPATKAWVPVEGSRVDLATKTVSAPLQHFSKYSVGGKAGW